MVVADLHVHTTNSDGQFTLETLTGVATQVGIETVAVTDHDNVHPELSAPVTIRDGVRIVHGIELRVETDTQRLDLLGYGCRRTDELAALTDRLQADRIERARKIIECVESQTGVELSVDLSEGVGRPHIARAIGDSETAYDYREAFAELIGDDCPCYVARDIPSFGDGKRILENACAVVGLAHPYRYGDTAAALKHAERLDAIEIPYPYDRAVDLRDARAVAAEYDLLVTGGSDAHDLELGRAGLDREQYDQFAAAL